MCKILWISVKDYIFVVADFIEKKAVEMCKNLFVAVENWEIIPTPDLD